MSSSRTLIRRKPAINVVDLLAEISVLRVWALFGTAQVEPGVFLEAVAYPRPQE